MNLDIGCSFKKEIGYIGMDIRPQAGVDIVHDIEVTPWPISDGECENIHASHILEHVKPWKLMDVMDECWRVMKTGGTLTVKTPYSLCYAVDPTHTILFQESSFFYFDPKTPFYEVYKPKPWGIVSLVRDESTLELKSILQKRPQ